MINYCPECGSDINNSPNFCPECGYDIKNNSSPHGSERREKPNRAVQSTKDDGAGVREEGEVVDTFGMVFLRGVASLFAAGVIGAGFYLITNSVTAGVILGVVLVLAGNFFYHYRIGKASVSGK